MNDRGDWPEVFWQVADEVAAGKAPAGYAQDAGLRLAAAITRR
jgi:hypothetical protein